MQRQAGQLIAPLLVLGVASACISANGDVPSKTHLPRAPRLHRVSAAPCPVARANEPPKLSASMTDPGCQKHADCTAGKNGRCSVIEMHAECTYDACVLNADCAGISVCECSATPTTEGNRCIAAGCRSDRDCGEGGYCSPSLRCGTKADVQRLPPGDGTAHYCHTTADECIDDVECPADAICHYDEGLRYWRCTAQRC